MATPKVSKMVTRCQERYDALARFVHTYRQTLVDTLKKVLQPVLKEDVMAPFHAMFLDGYLRRLGTLLQELLDAERRHLTVHADVGVFRAQRDQAARALRRLLFDLRDFVRANFGQPTTDAMGFARRIREEPRALLRQAQRILDRLFSPGFALPTARFVSTQALRTIVADALTPLVRHLRQSVELLEHQRLTAQGTRAAKLKAVKHFSKSYRSYANLLKAVCRFGNHRELMRRLHQTSSRRTRTSGSKTP